MCNCNAHVHPIQCIIPPHMLEVLAMRGDKKIADMAKSLLKNSEAVRADREDHSVARMISDTTTPSTTFLTPALASAATTRNLYREVHDGGAKAALPGKLARKEGDGPTGDDEVDRAYDGAGSVYDLYYDEYQRDSIDANGMKMVATVHHRRKYNNAFWNGRQMAYGDGDGRIFRTFTELSVIGHEISHGVVQFSGGLRYQSQSGALNESFADCFGSLVLQRTNAQDVCDASWLVGQGILGEDIRGVALRSMKAPGTAYSDAMLGQDPQPYHMDFYVNTTSDNGGVHINSGIPNHAFYLYCMYMGGRAWEKPGKIWYHAMQRLNNPIATFHDWAAQTVDSAIRLHGIGTTEVTMLRRAWKLVGLPV